MIKILAVPALLAVSMLAGLSPAALAKDHGRGGQEGYQNQQGEDRDEHDRGRNGYFHRDGGDDGEGYSRNRDGYWNRQRESGWYSQDQYRGEHDSRNFGHSRGRGQGQRWSYGEHERRGRGRSRGLARNQRDYGYDNNPSYSNSNGLYDALGRILSGRPNY